MWIGLVSFEVILSYSCIFMFFTKFMFSLIMSTFFSCIYLFPISCWDLNMNIRPFDIVPQYLEDDFFQSFFPSFIEIGWICWSVCRFTDFFFCHLHCVIEIIPRISLFKILYFLVLKYSLKKIIFISLLKTSIFLFISRVSTFVSLNMMIIVV